MSRRRYTLKFKEEAVKLVTEQGHTRIEEIKRLRKENARLKMEREILKKRRPSLPTKNIKISFYFRAKEGIYNNDAVFHNAGISKWLQRQDCEYPLNFGVHFYLTRTNLLKISRSLK